MTSCFNKTVNQLCSRVRKLEKQLEQCCNQGSLNIGDGSQVYVENTSQPEQFRTLISPQDTIDINQTIDEIEFDIPEGPQGESLANNLTIFIDTIVGNDDNDVYDSGAGEYTNDGLGGPDTGPVVTMERAWDIVRNIGYHETCTIVVNEGSNVTFSTTNPHNRINMSSGDKGRQQTPVVITGRLESAPILSGTVDTAISVTSKSGLIELTNFSSAPTVLNEGDVIYFPGVVPPRKYVLAEVPSAGPVEAWLPTQDPVISGLVGTPFEIYRRGSRITITDTLFWMGNRGNNIIVKDMNIVMTGGNQINWVLMNMDLVMADVEMRHQGTQEMNLIPLHGNISTNLRANFGTGFSGDLYGVLEDKFAPTNGGLTPGGMYMNPQTHIINMKGGNNTLDMFFSYINNTNTTASEVNLIVNGTSQFINNYIKGANGTGAFTSLQAHDYGKIDISNVRMNQGSSFQTSLFLAEKNAMITMTSVDIVNAEIRTSGETRVISAIDSRLEINNFSITTTAQYTGDSVIGMTRSTGHILNNVSGNNTITNIANNIVTGSTIFADKTQFKMENTVMNGSATSSLGDYYGLRMINSHGEVNNCSIDDAQNAGVFMTNSQLSMINLNSVGAGNGTYGVELSQDADMRGTGTITGTTNDVLVGDMGATTWANITATGGRDDRGGSCDDRVAGTAVGGNYPNISTSNCSAK